MQGLVTIDFGNTNPHAGLFQKAQAEWNLVKVVPWKELSIYLNQLQLIPDNTSMVLAEVKSREEDIIPLQHQGYLITRVKDYWRGKKFAGMPVHYANTLGEDRLIQAFFVYKTYKANTLIIDAGTFVTIDIVTQNGFEGGYICPGIENYLSTFQHGEQLKEVKIDTDLSSILPKTTSGAMRDSYFAFAALAQKLIVEHKIGKVVLTGGQSSLWKQFFSKQDSSVIVQEDSTLIHWALQYWMTTQIELL